MIFIVIMVLVLLVPCWLLFSSFELKVDTRIPQVSFRWISVGKAALLYDNDVWLLRIKILFFKKEWLLENLLLSKKKTKNVLPAVKKKKAKKIKQKK